MKWGITGVNRLTGCRELVSGAMPKELAVERRSSLMAIPARRRPYLRLKVVQLPYEEGSLNFRGGVKALFPLLFLITRERLSLHPESIILQHRNCCN